MRTFPAISSIIITLAACQTDAAPFQNGSFEDGGGWMNAGSTFYEHNTPYYGSTDGATVVVFNEFERAPDGVLWQTFDTVPSESYTVSFDWGSHAGNVTQRLQIEARDGSSPFAGNQLMDSGSGTISTISGASIEVNTDVLQVSDSTGSDTLVIGPAPNTKFSTFTLTFTAQSMVSTIVFRDMALGTTSTDSVLDNVRLQLPDSDGDGIPDQFETGTGIYVSPEDTGTSPTNPDTDGDGLNDGEEVNTHHSNPNVRDTDGDGFDDGFEVTTGFSPTSSASTPDALSSIRIAAEYRFNAANGISYRIEASTDLANWQTIETDIIGTGGVITRFYSTNGQPKRFFRSRRN